MKDIITALILLCCLSASAQSESKYPVEIKYNEVVKISGGEAFSLKVNFKVDSGWHIYAPTGINEAQGMYETKVVFRLPVSFSRKGKIKLPVSRFSGGFEVFEGNAITMEQELTSEPNLKPGEYSIIATITYQACTDASCLPPMSRDIVFKILVVKQDTSKKSNPIELTFTSLDKRKIDLKSLNAKLILIDCWASWCKPCVDEFVNVKRLYAKYSRKELAVIGISADESTGLPKVQQLINQHHLLWPQWFEGKGFSQNSFIKAQGIKSLPAVFLVDKDGNILDRDARGKRLEDLIERYLKN